MKRFYRKVAVRRQDDQFTIELDNRPIKTPAKAVLTVPSEVAAQAVADEWDGQSDEIDLAAMPLTAIASTAVDIVAPQREAVIDQIIAYAGHDLLCYWAEGPPDLVARQREAWQPLLDWAAQSFDARFAVTRGVVSTPQPQEALAALRRTIAGTDDLTLAAVSCATTAAGSVIIALALREGRLDALDADAAAHLDELYQAERWGEDREAAQRRAAIRHDLQAAAQIFALQRI